MMSSRCLLPILAGLIVGACTQSGGPPPAPATSVAGVTPSSFQLPAGSGCSGEIARFRAVMDNDLATGHVSKSVHARVATEIEQASAACAGGRDAEAVRLVEATKARYGYR